MLSEHLCSISIKFKNLSSNLNKKLIYNITLFVDKEIKFIEKVGAKIKKKRIESGHSQLNFAALLNIEDSALRRIEAGKTNPTLKTLYRIANALNLTICDLLKVEEDI